MPCPWLQFTHSPCLSFSGSKRGVGGGRAREREDVYHAVELPASQLVCLSPSLRPETERGRDIGGGSTASFFPSLLSSLPPSFCANFPFLHSCFYISCLRLPSKGQRALRSVCKCLCGVKQPDCIWLVHQAVAFTLNLNFLPPLVASELRL